MNQLRMTLGIVGVATALLLVVACQTPFSTGLEGSIGANGTSGTSILVLESVPSQLTLAGTYNIVTGSLTVTVQAPDGTFPFDETYLGAEHGRIDHALVPAEGTWILTVSTTAGAGSYDVELTY